MRVGNHQARVSPSSPHPQAPSRPCPGCWPSPITAAPASPCWARPWSTAGRRWAGGRVERASERTARAPQDAVPTGLVLASQPVALHWPRATVILRRLPSRSPPRTAPARPRAAPGLAVALPGRRQGGDLRLRPAVHLQRAGGPGGRGVPAIRKGPGEVVRGPEGCTVSMQRGLAVGVAAGGRGRAQNAEWGIARVGTWTKGTPK